MPQRYYDPAIGRFLSVDPVTALSNPTGQFNRYRYAANNPYRFIDPDGRVDDDPNHRPGGGVQRGPCNSVCQDERRRITEERISQANRDAAKARQHQSKSTSIPLGGTYTTKAHVLLVGIGEESSVTADANNGGKVCATTASCLYLGPGLMAATGPGVTAGLGSMQRKKLYFGVGFDASFFARAAGDISFNASGVSISGDSGAGEGGVIYAKICRTEASKGAGCE